MSPEALPASYAGWHNDFHLPSGAVPQFFLTLPASLMSSSYVHCRWNTCSAFAVVPPGPAGYLVFLVRLRVRVSVNVWVYRFGSRFVFGFGLGFGIGFS